MNRGLTYIIRYAMDEFLPPVIRDSKWFMYPFFYICFKGKRIRTCMEFKSLVYGFTRQEYEDFYRQVDNLTKDRLTDITDRSLKFMLDHLDRDAKTVLDVGCGKGYFLDRVSQLGYETCGCDLYDAGEAGIANYVQGNVESLPFADGQFDIVACSHTLEHVVNPDKAIAELKRVARRQLIICVPCQKYFYYTLDCHINFYPWKEQLQHAIGLPSSICENISGDWVYVARIP